MAIGMIDRPAVILRDVFGDERVVVVGCLNAERYVRLVPEAKDD